MKISIALCTFNGARFLPQQLDSLAAQSRRPDEVVVGDDASSDDSVAIIERWAAAAGIETRITRNPATLGPVANFEATIGRCRGEVICPCDQDDFWLPGKIAQTLAPLEQDPRVLLSICQSEICDGDLHPRGITVFDDQRFDERYRAEVRRGDGFRAYLRHLVAPGHAMAFRRAVLPQVLPFPKTCVHDQWIALVASLLGQTALIDAALVHYRYHAAQVTGGKQRSLSEWAALQSKLKLDHLQRNLQTHRLLRERVDSHIPPERRARLEGKIRFLEARMTLRQGRIQRTAVALRLLGSGAYHRHGRGVLTFLRDLKG